jgi:hypothetical protein
MAIRVLMTLSLFLAGCATTLPTATGSRYVIAAHDGVKWLRPCAYSAHTAAATLLSLNVACPFVLTDEPGPDEAWMLDAGIPLGRAPEDVMVLGARERCESIRSSLAVDAPRTLWHRVRAVLPAGCHGPFYFRQEA